jgi:predicted metal-dependent hydrolase
MAAVAEVFGYSIKRQRRKTIALHILADASIEVRAPKWVPKYEVALFVERRRQWLVDQRQQMLQKLALTPDYKHGHCHPYLGQKYPLDISTASRSSTHFQSQVLLMKVRDPESSEQVQKALEQWYRKQAVVFYEERMFACFEQFPGWFQDKYHIPEISIRKMRRRWGSCSSKGAVTLNLLLMKMPVACIDYVIIHELCHLEAFHHGKVFYRLLASIMPDWRERELLIEQLA